MDDTRVGLPEMTARHAHVPLERAPQFTVHRAAKSHPDRPALVHARDPAVNWRAAHVAACPSTASTPL